MFSNPHIIWQIANTLLLKVEKRKERKKKKEKKAAVEINDFVEQKLIAMQAAYV